MKKFTIFRNPLFLAGILTLLCIIITMQNLLLKSETFQAGMGYTHYNNYLIFKQSFFHLIQNKDLYQLFPREHWDYFKYSPTFALLMAPLAFLPVTLGLLTWNLLNVLILFFALWNLPLQTNKTRLFIVSFVLIELLNSVEASQSNGIIAGLLIFAFIFLEKKQNALASLFIVLTIFIKLFGVVSLALLIFYPDKVKTILYTIGWTLLLALLPLIVISMSQLTFQYQSWCHLLQLDHSISWGLSVTGWLHSWFGLEYKNLILMIGVVIFCLPFLKYRFFKDVKFKLFFFSSILIWIVIFNNKAEPPSYVIAISGVAIWFFSQKMKIENVVLVILAFILTVLSPTDIFPGSLRDKYVDPYMLKALPCILIWLKITIDLLFFRSGNTEFKSVTLRGLSSRLQMTRT